MYPRTYYETFMSYEAKDQIFVAMPFTDTFRHAYEQIIQPAIQRVMLNGRPLSSRIINRATSGSPDIHEQIFDAILHSRLVIADMTVQSSCSSNDGSLKWQANANVAYEVGLASAWRNPEDILLIYQKHPDHSYSFDVQNLRHVEYDPNNNTASIISLADEIVRALNQSSFLAKLAYQRLLESTSPSAVQFMHQESRRAFPMIVFRDDDMPIMDARIHAATELLSCGALKNRNVIRPGQGKGVVVINEWTELGLRMLLSVHAVTLERFHELKSQIASVPVGSIPPSELRDFPDMKIPTVDNQIDMVEATKIDKSNEATKKE